MKKTLLVLLSICFTLPAYAQSTLYSNSTSVGIGTNAPTAGAALDLSYNANSMLLPVGTTGQRPTGVAGMMRLNSTTPGVEAYYNGVWNNLGSGSGTVNSGTANQIAYYASNGTTLTGTNALPNGTTATTQSANDSSTNLATTAFANPASSLGSSGYVELPSGLIMEWGSGSTNTSAPVTATFPLAFPNNVFQVLVSASGVTTSTAFVTSDAPTTTGVDVSGWAVSGSRAATPYSYFAIGN